MIFDRGRKDRWPLCARQPPQPAVGGGVALAVTGVVSRRYYS
jgi:hypothetical protein